MVPARVVRRAADYLSRHGVDSPQVTAEILLANVLGTDRAGIYARSDRMRPDEARAFGRALCQRCSGVPLQHLTGNQPFRHLSLQVRPGVFVPRPETEVLVDAALDLLARAEEPVVVDVGTGTGAIALSVKHERPDATVFATDVSVDAVALARRNAAALGLDVRVLEGNLLAPLPTELRGWVDLVVSNPPYVPASEYADLPAEVRMDPPESLLGGVEGYRRLAADAARWLSDEGTLAVEVSAGGAQDVIAALRPAFAGLRVLPDLTGRDRIVVGRTT